MYSLTFFFRNIYINNIKKTFSDKLISIIHYYFYHIGEYRTKRTFFLAFADRLCLVCSNHTRGRKIPRADEKRRYFEIGSETRANSRLRKEKKPTTKLYSLRRGLATSCWNNVRPRKY